jgi:hypothetical protein
MRLWHQTKRGPEAGPIEKPKPVNRRAAERKRQRLIDGFILSDSMPTRPCTICDLSATGSRIELWGDAAKLLRPGDHLTLDIPSDGKEIDAEVRWRKADVMGLRFTSAYRTRTQPWEKSAQRVVFITHRKAQQ